MSSFELFYDSEEDVLEVTFEESDENLSRHIALNQVIVIHTDAMLSSAWGITFYSYARLLQVAETHLDELAPLDEANRNRVLALVVQPPVSHFLQLLNSDGLIALVKAPRIGELMK